jgi:hypothetical protein
LARTVSRSRAPGSASRHEQHRAGGGEQHRGERRPLAATPDGEGREHHRDEEREGEGGRRARAPGLGAQAEDPLAAECSDQHDYDAGEGELGHTIEHLAQWTEATDDRGHAEGQTP